MPQTKQYIWPRYSWPEFRCLKAEREAYYQVLEQTNTADGDITSWIKWFLECMSRAILNSGKLLSNVMLKARFWQRYMSFWSLGVSLL